MATPHPPHPLSTEACAECGARLLTTHTARAVACVVLEHGRPARVVHARCCRATDHHHHHQQHPRP